MYSNETHINIGTEEDPFWIEKISEERLKVIRESVKNTIPVGWKI